jgi:hypothetical protein
MSDLSRLRAYLVRLRCRSLAELEEQRQDGDLPPGLLHAISNIQGTIAAIEAEEREP